MDRWVNLKICELKLSFCNNPRLCDRCCTKIDTTSLMSTNSIITIIINNKRTH